MAAMKQADPHGSRSTIMNGRSYPRWQRGIRAGAAAGIGAAAVAFALCLLLAMISGGADLTPAMSFRPWWRLSNWIVSVGAGVSFAVVAGLVAVLRPTRETMHSHNTHLDERWGPRFCPVIARTTILGLFPPSRTGHGVALSCYRARLCEKELRNCWYARPMVTQAMPFDFDEARTSLKKHGRSYESGLDVLDVIRVGDIPDADKVAMLENLLKHPDEMWGPGHYDPTEVRAFLASLQEPHRSGAAAGPSPMTSEQVHALVVAQIGDQWDRTNLHGVDLRRCILWPQSITAADVRGEVQSDVWLVLLETPGRRLGWGIVYQEETGEFGLVQFTEDYAPCLVGLYAQFMDALEAM